jgi:hypothetical protein
MSDPMQLPRRGEVLGAPERPHDGPPPGTIAVPVGIIPGDCWLHGHSIAQSGSSASFRDITWQILKSAAGPTGPMSTDTEPPILED